MTIPRSIRILIVDDFESWRKELRSILQALPSHHIVDEARNGAEALEKAELRPDMVLLDLQLPDMNGIQVAEHIHRVLPECSLLLLTMTTDSDLASQLILRDGVQGYLLKTDVGEELITAINDVTDGKKFISKRLRC